MDARTGHVETTLQAHRDQEHWKSGTLATRYASMLHDAEVGIFFVALAVFSQGIPPNVRCEIWDFYVERSFLGRKTWILRLGLYNRYAAMLLWILAQVLKEFLQKFCNNVIFKNCCNFTWQIIVRIFQRERIFNLWIKRNSQVRPV